MSPTSPAAAATCPCRSGLAREACCGPYLDRKAVPSTAEALMRSRYTAFAEHDLDWIRDTLHPKLRADHDEEAIRKWSVKSEWLGLDITSVEKGSEQDDEGVVEFVARYKVDGRVVAHRERATFTRDQGRWVFLDSADPAPTTFRREAPKLGRNDPCACGSGKKAKKCCGQA